MVATAGAAAATAAVVAVRERSRSGGGGMSGGEGRVGRRRRDERRRRREQRLRWREGGKTSLGSRLEGVVSAASAECSWEAEARAALSFACTSRSQHSGRQLLPCCVQAYLPACIASRLSARFCRRAPVPSPSADLRPLTGGHATTERPSETAADPLTDRQTRDGHRQATRA